eukprot:13875110-Alexandrium_andersonii.AAC.1
MVATAMLTTDRRAHGGLLRHHPREQHGQAHVYGSHHPQMVTTSMQRLAMAVLRGSHTNNETCMWKLTHVCPGSTRLFA